MPSDYAPTSFTIDHIVPESLNGLTELKNLAYACGTCNRNKYDKISYLDEITKTEVKLYHPRKNKWFHHFRWNKDETTLIGLTPTGRATINLLQINRASNINQRSLLLLVGLHPPTDFNL